MYFFKIELREEYLKGEKIRYIASKLSLTASFLAQVLKRTRGCSIKTAKLVSMYRNRNVEDLFDYIEK